MISYTQKFYHTTKQNTLFYHTTLRNLKHFGGSVNCTNQKEKLNENKSGVFVNLSFLPKKTIEEIVEYINYIVIQENSILELETQTNELKKHISYEKENKDNLVYNNI